jgi:hypothetical protein
MRLLEIKQDGTEVWFEHDPIEKKNRILYKNPDVEPVLEYCKALRLATEYSKKGIKRDWWHYAHIPNWLLMKLRFEYGLDPWDKNNRKRVFEIINRDFPALKVTEGKHVPRN